MEPETALTLFDSSWFYLEIFEKRHPKTSEASSSSQEQQNPAQENTHRRVQKQPSIQRSKSDDLSSCYADAIASPDSVLLNNDDRRLETILSQKEYSDEAAQFKKRDGGSSKSPESRRKKRLSKSMSQLEYEELKGFVDLGFVFVEEDKMDSGLVGMIPGLQRMGHERMDGLETDPGITAVRSRRPYLSEAWSDLEREREREESLLMSWRVPIGGNDEVHIKENLRSWAHTVASAVRC